VTRSFHDGLREQVSQGGSLRDVPVVEADQTTVADVILLTQDCQYDKTEPGGLVLVAMVRSLSAVAPSHQGNVRSMRTFDLAYLPAETGRPETFVDLRRIAPLRKVEVERLSARGQRVASLSDDGQALLRARLHLFFSRQLPEPPRG